VTDELCCFTECGPKAWNGRYARIPGDSSVFHIRYLNGKWWPVIEWNTEEGLATCAALVCNAAKKLADAVTKAKLLAGGSGGGSFVINEFGQVLVPASDGSGRRYLIGCLEGCLLFENPLNPDDVIDLGDNQRLKLGDPWNLPHIGVPYHLSGRSKIYFYQQDEKGGRSVYPPQQDQTLIHALRQLRRTGAVKFIVNPSGLVLTKCPTGERWSPEEHWQSFFVGRLNRKLWFEKE
jgi:hypothetical protein